MNITSMASSAMLLTGLLGPLSGCGGDNGGDGGNTNSTGVNASGTGSSTAGAVVGSEAATNTGAIVGTAEPTCAGVGRDMPSSSAGTLMLQIGGTEAGVSHDLLEVSGRARVGGTLQLVFEESFAPSKGQRFTVVKASCLTGNFARVTANKGATLAVTQDATSLTVTVQ